MKNAGACPRDAGPSQGEAVVLTRTVQNHQFDLLRILFAILVVYSHAFELTDGNNRRELLSLITHQNFSFGMLAVDGFFLLSGYLIVKSWISKPDLLDFTMKRFLRIAPGYAVATLTTTFVIGYLAPTQVHQLSHLRLDFARSLLFIFPPSSPEVFPGNHNRILNGSLWTILYEFRCYVFVAIFGIHASPWVVFFQATLISICLGWLSWTFVEKPAMSLRSSRKQQSQVIGTAALRGLDRDVSPTPLVLDMRELEAKPSDNLAEPG